MSHKTVLIIDDEKRMADSLGNLLGECGYKVTVTYSGRGAIDCLRRESFNVVVTDLRMVDMDGLDVIRYIHDNFPHSLIIVITGHASTDSAIEALHYRVFDYLRKPFDFELFRMAIEKAFHKIDVDQLREDTAAMITHDIKIPLTSIIGFTSMIYDRDNEDFHPRAREFIETIQANGQKILMLIENYLTTCKIESGTLKVVRAPLELRLVVDDVIESVQPELSHRKQTLTHEIDERITTAELDEVLIYRAVSNLIQNAIKYSNGEGDIQLRLLFLEAEQSPIHVEALCIEVINWAGDLNQDELGNVFQRYKRAHTRPGIGGSGIGLYVVQAVAQAHGGDVAAEFIDDQRVRFALYLPIQAQNRIKT